VASFINKNHTQTNKLSTGYQQMCIKNGIKRVFGEKKTTATDFEK